MNQSTSVAKSKRTSKKALAAVAVTAPLDPATTPPAAPVSRVFFAPEGYRRLTVNLPHELHKKLRLAAVEQDCTATDIIVQLLSQKLG